MYTEELMFEAKEVAPPAPSADLWARIARAHLARRARRRRLRVSASISLAIACLAIVVCWPARGPTTDWQARAQALEIELSTLPVHGVGFDNPAALEAESRLMQLDEALQSAYDRGAASTELSPLWKQRSELLSTLLAVRQENVAVTRI